MSADPGPKRWHEAKPGEVWALRLNDESEEILFMHGDGEFHFRNGDHVPNRLRITAGRCIWPDGVTA